VVALLWAGASGYSVITPVSEASVGVLYERGPLDGAIEAASVGGAIGAKVKFTGLTQNSQVDPEV
jgi:hypothetical protein